MVRDANNVGYLYMAVGEYNEAQEWFSAARDFSSEEDLQLLSYNEGVLAVIKKDYTLAATHFKEAFESPHPTEAVCLYEVYLSSGQIMIREVFQPKPIVEMAKAAIEILQGVSSSADILH